MDSARRDYRDMDIDELQRVAADKGVANVWGSDREALIRSLEDWEGRADTESSHLQHKSMEELLEIAAAREVSNRRQLPKPQLISAILAAGEERSSSMQNTPEKPAPSTPYRERMVDHTHGSKRPG